LIFTAHSVPRSMAFPEGGASSPYVRELEAACAQVAANVGRTEWTLAYQSRSGPPAQPWLEPDVCDHLRATRADAVIVPLGFLSDHMEVLYDLDVEARAVCTELGIRMVRAGSVGNHPAMIEMIAELVTQDHAPCAAGCCPAPQRPAGRRP
jgi:ferrochelatase